MCWCGRLICFCIINFFLLHFLDCCQPMRFHLIICCFMTHVAHLTTWNAVIATGLPSAARIDAFLEIKLAMCLQLLGSHGCLVLGLLVYGARAVSAVFRHLRGFMCSASLTATRNALCHIVCSAYGLSHTKRTPLMVECDTVSAALYMHPRCVYASRAIVRCSGGSRVCVCPSCVCSSVSIRVWSSARQFSVLFTYGEFLSSVCP